MNIIIQKLYHYCNQTLDFKNAKLSDEYRYASLPFAIIDAIFSIGVRYSSTRSTVIRYCDYYGLQRIRISDEYIDESEQHTISQFIDNINSCNNFAEDVLKNKQRTSSRNGILKADATLLWARILQSNHIETLQSFKAKYTSEIEKELCQVKGQSSGLSSIYLNMLCGDSNFCKPDRHIVNFVSAGTNEPCSPEEASTYILAVCKQLQQIHPELNARLLDHTIWKYMSSR